ncbi:MAG TPA: DUF1330 domain-containing protein [Gemmatimonadales bacterium]|nr:DUF1330 domain-containing protein [Gemmatimonadales bacterium]
MPSDTPRPAYFIAHLHVADVDRYRREYGREVLSQVAAVGAKLLVASPGPTVLEGDWDSTWTAVIQFPDRAAALRWYQSQEYAPLKRLRLEELTAGGTVVLFDGYQPPATAS